MKDEIQKNQKAQWKCMYTEHHRYMAEARLLEKPWVKENGAIFSFLVSSGKIFLWQCEDVEHHKWKAQSANQTHPEVVKKWDHAANGSSHIFMARSNKKSTGCPVCCNQKVCEVDACNSLDVLELHLVTACPKDKLHVWAVSPHELTSKKTHGDYGVLELDEYCKKLVLVFEYDGVQHEGEIKFFTATRATSSDSNSYSFLDPAAMKAHIKASSRNGAMQLDS
ncbi:hypothetical protein PHYSODRAFT_341992 [Phytophthora sojae]|uniref:Uncharacterized protein n=1 Tax=Phytophthora sojae (strain P6497) TaxID=1094619 RepID=G5AF05_PHYSP|nr:hypothetical protein PHYSODRAFT_341992 [Phytophthora sojae]EGZ05795.1 hypothetical protein PHYSODRAFT_341992 [Phytophthora sojae]|eukprot:XP_009538656.1 hypothetical protein PHYSODRAFT_341992 [Phytophthora sojae]